MPKSLSWKDLQFFLAVYERGSIGAAARWLAVRHSTVLRHIGSLEESLGQRLFDRLPGGYALTTEGQELVAGLAGITDQIESAQRRVGAGAPDVRGAIRLTTTDTLAHGVLMPHFARFQLHFPTVELQVVINSSFLSLTQREADIAIRGTNRPPENLVGRRVGVMQTALYASRDYLGRLGQQAAFADYAWIGPDESLAHLDSAKWLRKNVASDRIVMRVDSLVGVANAASAGAGVALLSCVLGEKRPELVRISGPFPELDTQVWILTHPELKQVRRIRAFMDYMSEHLKTDPVLLPKAPAVP